VTTENIKILSTSSQSSLPEACNPLIKVLNLEVLARPEPRSEGVRG